MSNYALLLGSEIGRFDMVLCDTNIFISAFNGREDTINQLNTIGLVNIVLSSITVMELYQGMGNKTELAQMRRKIKYYDVVQIDDRISKKAIEFIETYKLSHGLLIPDAIIGATAVVHQIPLYTYNVKDFDFLPSIVLHKSV
ncbi:type II toxin-antitoxin system VapC family toxin [Haliscomenobacter hydrossis]|uniref:Ribonuclease VapC n=1 Tax=Haliscomenobacter hydrossis (strain ATCC 27775 / DSM 1100 / LMG 10767 / O) TaxID=760192 RepID=F4KYH9_HALH1|nr:type II toxin-antitoxin system VapC family toxin [Haliscomenobacter hydrossis]AEE49420.1 PilT protein domain protein [Haliscomenobacter hydrossis DSM 1100]